MTLRHGEIKTPAYMEECCHIPKGWGEEIIIESLSINSAAVGKYFLINS